MHCGVVTMLKVGVYFQEIAETMNSTSLADTLRTCSQMFIVVYYLRPIFLIKTDQYVSMSMSGLLNFIVISDPVLVDMFDFRCYSFQFSVHQCTK